MGREALDDDAVALTPALFIGYKLNIDHVDSEGLHPSDAVEIIRSGGTVLVRPDEWASALFIMLKLGVTTDAALEKLDRAFNVLPDEEDFTF